MKGIYKITNNINNHCYIGQSICIEKRWKAHRIASTNPNDEQYNAPLYQAFRKYGIENFTWEVLEETTDDLLDEKEIYYINLYNSFKEGYNQTPGGRSGGGGRTLSSHEVEEIQAKLLTQKYTLQQLSEEYKVHKDTIRDINNGTTWNCLNPQLKYPLYISYKNKDYKKYINVCKKCGVEISSKAIYCVNCYREQTTEKYPDKEQLTKDIKQLGFCGTGRKYGVSDNAIRKYCKKIGLSTYIKDYKNVPKEEFEKTTKTVNFLIEQYDLNGNYIQTFDSGADAARWIYENGMCKTLNSGVRGHINDAANGKRKTAYKFIWKKIESEN